MLVEVQKWGNSAAVRVPATMLKELEIRVGQKLDMKAIDGRLVLERPAETLEELVGRITPTNRHGLVLDDDHAAGNEIW